MHLFYLDESGNSGSALSVEQPVHWLIAVGATPSAVKRIEDEMLDIALRYFPIRARRPEFEFHGQLLFSGRGECRSMEPQKRIDAYAEILQLIPKNDCKIFVRGIDKVKHQRRALTKGYEAEHPHRLACMYLIEQIDRWLEQQGTAGGLPEYGLLIADEQKEHERDIVASFAGWRHGGTVGYKARSIRFLIDTVHYVPSHDSWLIQLADCVAFIKNRSYRVWLAHGNNHTAYTASESAVVDLWANNCRPNIESSVVWPE